MATVSDMLSSPREALLCFGSLMLTRQDAMTRTLKLNEDDTALRKRLIDSMQLAAPRQRDFTSTN